MVVRQESGEDSGAKLACGTKKEDAHFCDSLLNFLKKDMKDEVGYRED